MVAFQLMHVEHIWPSAYLDLQPQHSLAAAVGSVPPPPFPLCGKRQLQNHRLNTAGSSTDVKPGALSFPAPLHVAPNVSMVYGRAYNLCLHIVLVACNFV